MSRILQVRRYKNAISRRLKNDYNINEVTTTHRQAWRRMGVATWRMKVTIPKMGAMMGTGVMKIIVLKQGMLKMEVNLWM